MRWERGDTRVGLAVLAAIALIVGALLWLSPMFGDRATTLYARFDRVDGLEPGAPVQLGGFTIGRVEDIQPRLDGHGSLGFVVRLRLTWHPSGGDALPLVAGTKARLLPPPVTVGSTLLVGVVALELPPGGGPPLPPGSTIAGERETPAIEQLEALAGSTQGDLARTLEHLRGALDTISRSASSVTVASAAVRSASSDVSRASEVTSRDFPRVLAQTSRELTRVDSLIGDARLATADVRALAPSMGARLDSAALMIAESRRLVGHMDRSVSQHDPELARVLANLDTTSALLHHFVREVSRRPYRALSGVRPTLGDH